MTAKELQKGLFAVATSSSQSESKSASGEWIAAHTDGGSRGNPGPAGYGVAIRSADGHPLAELSEFIGVRSNNVAEYSALLAALEWALENGRRRLRVVSDSELMVKQIQGRYKVASPDLKPMFEEAKRRIARLDGFEISHALRHKNKDADRLANLAMDRGTKRGAAPGQSVPPLAATPYPKAARSLRGVVRHGKIELLGGTLPDGTFVKIERE